MPVLPEHRAFYRTPEWRQRARYVVHVRARGRCEVCGVAVHGLPIPYKPGAPDPRTEITLTELHAYLRARSGRMVVLTCAHWFDPTLENLAADNLRAACQRCHNRRDEQDRKATSRRRREQNREVYRAPTPVAAGVLATSETKRPREASPEAVVE